MFDRWAQRMGITDGKITREQFNSGMQQRLGGPPGGGPGNGGNNTDRAEAMFRRFDTNGDGVLNNDEMVGPLEALRTEREKWDADGNGLIDLTEFKAYFQARIQQMAADRNAAGNQPEWLGGIPGEAAPAPQEDTKPTVYRAGKLPPGLPPWFEQLDTDHDAQIGLYEWKVSGRPIDEFVKMDRNGDGFLTVEEVLYFTKGSSSPATNGNGNAGANGQPPAGSSAFGDGGGTRPSFYSGPGGGGRGRGGQGGGPGGWNGGGNRGGGGRGNGGGPNFGGGGGNRGQRNNNNSQNRNNG